MNWLSSLFSSNAPMSTPPIVSYSGTRTEWQKPILKSDWMIKSIRCWCQLTVNDKPDGNRQFCKLLAQWSIKYDGNLNFNFSFDRKLTFLASRSGVNLIKIYNKSRGGEVILIIKTAVRDIDKGGKVILQ